MMMFDLKYVSPCERIPYNAWLRLTDRVNLLAPYFPISHFILNIHFLRCPKARLRNLQKQSSELDSRRQTRLLIHKRQGILQL